MAILDDRSGIDIAFDAAGMDALRKRAEALYLKAARDAVAETARTLEQRLEAATAGAGLGRLAKAWNVKVYPKTGLSSAPSASIYPKGRDRTEGAIEAYSQGAHIAGKSGQYLAIALPAAGPRFAGRGKVPVTPAEWERRTGLRLRAAKIGNGLFLVTDGVVGKKTGRIAKAATHRRLAQGRKVETLKIFALVKNVTVRKRFSIKTIESAGQDVLEQNFERKIAGLSAQLNRDEP